MSLTIAIKGIKSKRLKVDAIRKEILNALRAEGVDQRKALKETVATWQGDKPKFETLIGLERGDGSATVITGPAGNTKGAQKWVFLDKGTKIRWALMSPNWKSKTAPGRFKSTRGAGRPVIVGKRAMQRRNIKPRPGIKARNWSETLTRRRRRPFQRRIVKAIQRGAKKLF